MPELDSRVEGRTHPRPLLAVLTVLAMAIASAAGAVAAPSPTDPAGARSQPGLGTCTVFPAPPASLPPNAPSVADESAWNQDISQAPVDPRSSAYIAYIDSHGSDHLHPDFGSPRIFGLPYSVVGAAQPELPIHYTAYGRDSDKGPFPIPKGAPVEGGPHSDGDRHVLVVDRADCMLYELYRAFYSGKGGGHWNADSGAKWDLRSTGLRPDSWTSADAAGLPIFAGLARYEEAASGAIHHAIRVTFDNTRNAWIHPASHCASDISSPDAPPMGLRLRLKASYSLGGFRGQAKAIAVALEHYGLIVADNGMNWYFTGATDHRWDDGSLNRLKRIPGSAFEVVKSAARVHVC